MKSFLFIVLTIVAFGCEKPESGTKETPKESPKEVVEATTEPEAPAKPLEGIPLKEGEKLGGSWDEGPDTKYVWSSTKQVQVELQLPEGDETDGTLAIWNNGQAKTIGEFTYDAARGGSGFSMTALSSKQLEAVFTYGAGGEDPGSVDAFLVTWEDGAKEPTLAKVWTGDGLADRPSWDKVPAK